MTYNLQDLDRDTCQQNLNRLALSFGSDLDRLRQLIDHYAFWDDMIEVAKNHSKLDKFIKDNFVTGSTWNTGLEINYLTFLEPDMTIWTSAGVNGTVFYYPPPEYDRDKSDSENQVQTDRATDDKDIPLFAKKHLDKMHEMHGNKTWGTITVDSRLHKSFIVTCVPIMNQTGNDRTVYGFILAARNLRPRLHRYANDVPVSLVFGVVGDENVRWNKTDYEMFDKVVNGTLKGDCVHGTDCTFDGTAAFRKMSIHDVGNAGSADSEEAQRHVPESRLFDETSELMVGYYLLEDIAAGADVPGVRIRVDRPMAMVNQGSRPVLILSIEIIVMMIVLCVIFLIFLDCVVLQRIVELSKIIRKQTMSHMHSEDDQSSVGTASEDGDGAGAGHHAHGKRGKSSGSGAESDATSSTGDTSSSSGAHDEIGNLKRAMEANSVGLRKRLEAVTEAIKAEQQKTIRHRQAMQLLNLWCGRRDYFPGLRPNAMQLRYEPTRNLDDLLANPLAVEYLKSHCETDRSLENLWFLLDVSWLEELEKAEDNEDDPEQRAQIREVASGAAMTILSRYLAANAPQQINVSAGTFEALRNRGDVYERGMFDEAVGEVKLMLDTDILPRFQKSTAYTAMSETLFIDQSGGADSSEVSDETVSTAGSILTDEAEDTDGGVTRVFAHTLKNLHTTFDIARDQTDGSSTYSADSSHAASTTALPTSAAASRHAGTTVLSSTPGKEDSTAKSSEGTQPDDAHSKQRSADANSKDGSETSSDSSSSSSSQGNTSSVSDESVTVSSGTGSASDSGSATASDMD